MKRTASQSEPYYKFKDNPRMHLHTCVCMHGVPPCVRKLVRTHAVFGFWTHACRKPAIVNTYRCVGSVRVDI